MVGRGELFEIVPTATLTVRSNVSVENLPQMIGSTYGAIMQYLGEIGEHPAGEPFVIYYNMDMQNLDVEVGFPVTKKLPGNDNIKPSELPTGPAAKITHLGPYAEFGKTYDELTKFVTDQGLNPSGVAIEYYINSPDEVPPEKLETRIVFPLK